MDENKYHSYNLGNLPKGCQYCVKGKKMVIFITGLCGMNCYYCPISDYKKENDVIFANEWEISSFDDLIEEANLTEARGAGITGGDPLVKLSRCVEYIVNLKKKFGSKFHIHLYTPTRLVNEDKLKKLFDAGLDEIRFHLSLDSEEEWKRIELALNYSWDVGVEIPLVPGKKDVLLKMVDYLEGKVKFLNLNELELSDTNAQSLEENGFVSKDGLSYGVKDSVELGLELLEYSKNKNLDVHLCTCRLKDDVQLRNRIMIRAKNVALPVDKITSEGTLIRGCVYLDEIKPGFGYRKKLAKVNKIDILPKLEKLKNEIISKHNIKNVYLDDVKYRLFVAPQNLKRICKKLSGCVCAIVEEYPTRDAMELEVEFL